MRINRTFTAFASGIALSIAAVAGINACTDPGLEAPIAPAPEQVADLEAPVVVEPAPAAVDPRAELRDGFTSDGMVVGDVIICPEGWAVSQDVTPDGVVWAACM